MDNNTISVVIAESKVIVQKQDEIINVSINKDSVKIIELGNVVLQKNSDCNNIYTLGEVVGGQKLVYLKDGKLYKASYDNIECYNKIIGMTMQAGEIDSIVEVKTEGIIYLNNWQLQTNAIYYLGLDGNISTQLPDNNIAQIIGYAKSENELELNIGLSILRG